MIPMRPFLLFLSIVITAVGGQTIPDLKKESHDLEKTREMLKSGINENLNGQKLEMQIIDRLLSMTGGASSGGVGAEYKRATEQLARTIRQGQTLRKRNQTYASRINSRSLAGLNKVEKAQGVELAQAESLTGGSKDREILLKLKSEVSDGTRQNQRNLLDV